MDSRFVIVDGHNIAYRSFYAIREMNRSDGVPTNAVFGCIRTLEAIKQRWKPTHWAVTFDGGLPKERMALLETYKAQRKPLPDELRTQLDWIQRYLTAARISWLLKDGCEADDLMATLAERAAADGADVLVVTGDKDLLQLVGDRVGVINPAKPDLRMDAEAVKAKTGVAPEQVLGWLALMGDVSDNVPGVPGVGTKTAAKLMNTYGALEEVLRCAADVHPERIGKALAEHADRVRLNERIMSLDRNLTLEKRWDDMRCDVGNAVELLRLYEELEFHTMASALREPELF